LKPKSAYILLYEEHFGQKNAAKGAARLPRMSFQRRPLTNFQNNMRGAAEEAGFNGPDDVGKYIKQLRKSKRN
jgi:hypothetical protein